MKIPFYKYQGTGNDFVIIDNRHLKHSFTKDQVVQICDRHFGIGSDGLILIQDHNSLDFEMVFYNPDASQSFCGNGSRCAVSFAKSLGIFDNQTRFLSTDGEHEAELLGEDWVTLKMADVHEFEQIGKDVLINTGSPHYLTQWDLDHDFDIVTEARKIRYNQRFEQDGVNVNFINWDDHSLYIRTYERGVENETLSCGTGVTAAALGKHIFTNSAQGSFVQNVRSQGGNLKVAYTSNGTTFTDIWLQGPAKAVFNGTIELN